MNYALLALGGAIGTLIRFYLSSNVISYLKTPPFPWGTVTINLIGSLVIGMLAGWNDTTPFSTSTRLFLFVGLLGGFTTFSAYSLETINLFRSSMPGYAILNILISNIGGIFFAYIGYVIIKSIHTIS
ncbi:MAG TPA: fluoride efflux transporter CrcB [Bacteroidia bacterium]|mgnify:CR=1 FL=1|nr:fluoride efflux transporter CrcB [Bacteroidia bacterium]HNQ00078.1 fluoride efflux transporter CrcB [Bacteroidia bacterium]